MNKNTFLSRYGLKWNPFRKDLPTIGMTTDSHMESFCFQVENLVMDGGFALITGPAGTGKSITMRYLADRLAKIPEVTLVEIARPQSRLIDFYRELGEEFGVQLKPSNRWGGYRSLRENWSKHIATTLFRPIIFIDEAQETPTEVLNELRIMSSDAFDSKNMITVILSGDERLTDRFHTPELVPLGSRVKAKLIMRGKTPSELIDFVKALLREAGNPVLMNDNLIQTLAEKSMGNYRTLVQMADSLLLAGAQKELDKLDEKLFFETFDSTPKGRSKSRGK